MHSDYRGPLLFLLRGTFVFGGFLSQPLLPPDPQYSHNDVFITGVHGFILFQMKSHEVYPIKTECVDKTYRTTKNGVCFGEIIVNSNDKSLINHSHDMYISFGGVFESPFGQYEYYPNTGTLEEIELYLVE